MTPADSETRRRYDATARQERARADRLHTRTRVIAAAREAFLAHGYARSSVASIAAAAGVSVQTVYLAVGPKADLLRAVGRDAVLGGEDADSVPELAWVARVAAEPDPRAQIRLLVVESLALAERAYPIWRVFADAAAHDSALEADVRELEAGRHRDQRALVRLLSGLTVPHDRAADIVQGILSPELWRLFVLERGWSADEVAQFATDVLAHALLAPRRRG